MKNNLNILRFKILNKYKKELHINNNKAFTTLTQWFDFKNFEDIADTIIKYELFEKFYGISWNRVSIMSHNSFLNRKRLEVILTQNRKLTKEEENEMVIIDNECEIEYTRQLNLLHKN